MTEVAPASESSAFTQQPIKETSPTAAPSSSDITTKQTPGKLTDMIFSPTKRRCLDPQPNLDSVFNESFQHATGLGFDADNFVSEIKITVSDYISQQYLVRGSPSYKVLKVGLYVSSLCSWP